MCLKQTSVSHSSTESEVIPLHAGLRMDVIPALDLRGLIKSIAFFLRKKKVPASGNRSRDEINVLASGTARAAIQSKRTKPNKSALHEISNVLVTS